MADRRRGGSLIVRRSKRTSRNKMEKEGIVLEEIL